MALALFVFAPQVVQASDHADPVFLKDPVANITGLFFFPKGDQMILVFNVRRATTAPKPYATEDIEFTVHMDLHSKLTFDDAGGRARYGGTVVNPGGISDDVSIAFQLNPDTTVKSKSIKGLKDPDTIKIFTGLRDDPFIFPRFFKRNVISMVLSIPISSFPAGQQDWLLWGTTTKNGEVSDHVGRSNRTQLGRFNYLNTLPPSQHVSATMEQMGLVKGFSDFFKKYQETVPLASVLLTELQIRPYDVAPDVMVYTNRFPAGFPNGRLLTDDVALITCLTGDCVLVEISYIEGPYPRAIKNDKEFLDEFPYLAEPWPDSPEPPNAAVPLATNSLGFLMGLIQVTPMKYIAQAMAALWLVIAVGLILFIGYSWLLVRWARKGLRPA